MSAALAGRVRRQFMQLGLALLVACNGSKNANEFPETTDATLVVFTTMAEPGLEELLGGYARRLGVQLEMTHGELQAFHEMTQTEGHSPDLFIAGNIQELTQASHENVFRPIRSALVLERVPQAWRDPDQSWTALAVRGRGVVFNPVLVTDSELESIASLASLADDTWHDRLCLSSSSVAGNRTLIAALLRDRGERQTEIILRGWRDNLSQAVYADDEQLLRAITDGLCAVGIADSGNLARLVDIDGAASVLQHRYAGIDDVQVELSGAGVTRHARNPEKAAALLDVLTEADANAKVAALLYALPANPQAPATIRPDLRRLWPPDGINAGELGYLLEDAVRLAERARYP